MSIRSTLVKVFAAVALAFATVSSVQAQAPAPAAGPNITIHYHRVDGNYEKWGIHLWKSPNMPLEGVEWPTPMVPTGKDAYGVYWTREAAEFKTRTKMVVNYIIHKGDIKEQGGKDMSFDGMTHQEAWIWENDSKIYFSLDEVKAAHPEYKQ